MKQIERIKKGGCMINLHYVDFHEDFTGKIKDVLQQNNIETSMKGVHLGNCCICNVTDELLPLILAVDPSGKYIQYRNKHTILESEDLESFNVGDKVLIEYLETSIFPVRNQRGTVVTKSNSGIIVRAYRCKNMGWRIYIGDHARLKIIK